MARQIGLLLLSGSVLSGCASMPAVTEDYYFPKASIKFTITQTIGCMPDNKQLISAVSVTAAPAAVADLDGEIGHFHYRSDDNTVVDTDLVFKYTLDGRLSAVNSTSTGEAGTIVKSAVALATSVATRAVGPQGAPTEADIIAACAVVDRFGAGGAKAGTGAAASPKTLSLTYTLSTSAIVDAGNAVQIIPDDTNTGEAPWRPGQPVRVQADINSRVAYDALHKIIPGLEFVVSPLGAAQPLSTRAVWEPNPAAGDTKASDPAHYLDGAGFAPLQLNKVARAGMQIIGPGGDWSRPVPIWKSYFQLPVRDYLFLPVPVGKPFGKATFALTLAEDGSIASLEYAKNSGAADALAAAGAVATALKPPNAAAEAASLGAQADEIYEQRRLVICRTAPASCPAK
jgi:hypothetical protein